MKLNRLIVVGITSAFVAAVPIAQAVASQNGDRVEQASVQILSQAQSAAIASGTFVAGEAPTTGTARIVTEGGHRYLELDAAFSTSDMAPDLHVLLDSNQQPPQSYSNLGGAINLGSLHDFNGAQRFPIPDSIDLADFSSVVVWCRMANATFGYAPLNPVSSASIQ